MSMSCELGVKAVGPNVSSRGGRSNVSVNHHPRRPSIVEKVTKRTMTPIPWRKVHCVEIRDAAVA